MNEKRLLPFKRILCPTDFSEPACRAIKAAGELAEAFSAELILMHVVGAIPTLDNPAGMGGFDVAAYQHELTESAEASLKERLKRNVPSSVDGRVLVTHGDAAHEIVRVASEEGVDLIVLATHGRHPRCGRLAAADLRFGHGEGRPDRPLPRPHRLLLP